MRNLTFLASPAIAPAAASFRRSFMEKTASWSVAIEECHTRGEARGPAFGKEEPCVCGLRPISSGGIRGW